MVAPAVPVAPKVTYGLPFIITKGGTYTGAWSEVTIATTEPVTIADSAVKGAGQWLIGASWVAANVTIRNTWLESTNTTGQTRAVMFDGNLSRLIIENCDIVSTAGCYLRGNDKTPQTHPLTEVGIRYNRFRDIVTYTGAYVQAVQFNATPGGTVEVAWNEIVNTPGKSRPEDTISIYASGGTQANPWKIHDNLIWGAWPMPIGNPAGYSGGGIMHGDGNLASQGWGVTTGNVVLGTSNYGIAVAGGCGWTITDNIVVGSGRTSSGTVIPTGGQDAGLYMRPYSSPVVATMARNKVGWWNPTKNIRNDSSIQVGTFTPGTALPAGEVTYAQEQAEYDAWVARASSAGIVVGRTVPTPTPPVPVVPTQAQYDALAARVVDLTAQLASSSAQVTTLTSQLATATAKTAALLSAVDNATAAYR